MEPDFDSIIAFPFLAQGLCAVATAAALSVAAAAAAVAMAAVDSVGHLKPTPIKTIALFHRLGSTPIAAPVQASNL